MTEKKYTDFHQRWEWIITFIVLEDMFVHEILMMMDKSRNDAVDTMAISLKDNRICLEYAEPFCDSLTDPELRYVITHEVYHLVLHHCTLRLPENKEDRKLYNMAADLAINSLIPQGKDRHMPKDKKTGKNIGLVPKDMGFEEKLSMEQYVQLLREQQDQNKKDGKSDQQSSEGFDNHDGWKESSIIKEIIRNKIEQLAKDERVWGKMPGETKALILAAQKSYVSWERYLKHYYGTIVSPKQTRTMKRPDRRFGYPYPGKKRGYTDHKLVAIDASGSTWFGDDDLAQFLTETNKLAEIQPVDLVLFDTTITVGPISFAKKHVSLEFKGGGGTDFNDVFKLADERRYQSLIILTDGAASAPPKPEFVKDILWVLTGNGDPPVDWGTRIRIVPKGQPQIPVTT